MGQPGQRKYLEQSPATGRSLSSVRFGLRLGQSQVGNYIDTGLASSANTVIPAYAGTQGMDLPGQRLTPVLRRILLLQVAQTNTLPIAEADSGV